VDLVVRLDSFMELASHCPFRKRNPSNPRFDFDCFNGWVGSPKRFKNKNK
jgi:hypothetical protein